MYLLFKENNKIIRKEKIDEYLIKKPILNTLRAKYLYRADYLMQEKDYSDLQKAVTDPADKQVVDFLLGKEFIRLWVGQAYIMSYYIALVVITPALIPFSQNIGISVLRAMNKHKFRSIIYFFIVN